MISVCFQRPQDLRDPEAQVCMGFTPHVKPPQQAAHPDEPGDDLYGSCSDRGVLDLRSGDTRVLEDVVGVEPNLWVPKGDKNLMWFCELARRVPMLGRLPVPIAGWTD